MMFQRPRSDSVDSLTGAKRTGRYSAEGVGLWTDSEHDRFMTAIAMYPKGPWRLVADFVGTRNARQTMTHAQKYKQKLARRMRGLRTPGRVSGQRSRQSSLTESELTEFEGTESSSEYMDQASEFAARPSLAVVIRTGIPHDPVAAALAEAFGGGLSPLLQVTADDADAWSAIGRVAANQAGDDATDLALEDDLFQLLDMDCDSIPTSPALDVAAASEPMCDYDELSLQEFLGMAYMT